MPWREFSTPLALAAKECVDGGNVAVLELGAALDGDGPPGQAMGVDSTAGPVARVEHQDASAGARHLDRSGQPGDTGAYDDDVGVRPSNRGGPMGAYHARWGAAARRRRESVPAAAAAAAANTAASTVLPRLG